MKPLKQFSIPFTGLKIGKHQFDFDLDSNFFAAFEYSLIKDGDLKAEVELDKQETMLILNFKITGTVKLTCDTCLADVSVPLDSRERQIIKFAEDELESDDPEIIVIQRKESEIDISGLIYEFVTVAVPYIVNCGEVDGKSQCDKEMLATLESLAVKNKEEETGADPRWDALKKLK